MANSSFLCDFQREQRCHLFLCHDGVEELLLRDHSVRIRVHLLEGGKGERSLVLARLLVLVAQEVEDVVNNLFQLLEADGPVRVSVESGKEERQCKQIGVYSFAIVIALASTGYLMVKTR